MNAELRQRIEQAFAALTDRRYICSLDSNHDVCAGFERDHHAPGFAVVLAVSDTTASIDCGAGTGEDDDDEAVAAVVAAELAATGLVASRQGSEVEARLADTDTEALAKRVADFIRQQHGLPSGEVVHVVLHDDNGKVLWRGDAK